jgi:hypothetical protein
MGQETSLNTLVGNFKRLGLFYINAHKLSYRLDLSNLAFHDLEPHLVWHKFSLLDSHFLPLVLMSCFANHDTECIQHGYQYPPGTHCIGSWVGPQHQSGHRG